MTQQQLDPWKAALMQLQGMSNAFQIGDPMKRHPSGSAPGSPLVNGAIATAAGGGVLYSRGWPLSTTNLLLPGDYFQVGLRLHCVLDVVTSDSAGKAAINIWPSLREVPIDGQPIITNRPLGLFRLANNKGTWSSDYTGLSRMSFQIVEYR